MQNVLSWVQTADMAARAWVKHTTPERYTRETLELADETIRQTTNDLLKSHPARIDSAAVDSLLSRSSGRIAQIARLVEARNAPDVTTQLDSLHVESQAIKSLADKLQAAE